MTVETDRARVDYNGNDATVLFAVNFPFLADTDLLVIRTDADGEETTLTLNSGGADGYTVDGAGDEEGSVTVVTAPATGERLSIIRQVPILQPADFVANDPFPAETFETSLDRITMICADLQAQIDRCLHFSPGTSTGVSAILPAPDGRALLGWTADETGIANFFGADFTDLIISVWADGWLQLTTAAEARTYLGVSGDADLGPLATLFPTGTGFLSDAGVYTENLNSMPVGYRRTAWTTANANTGFVLADYNAGKGFVKESTATPTWTIPANGSVAFPIGTMIPLSNIGASGDVTLAITTDILQRAGGTSTGSVTLEPGFHGAVEKVTATHWMVFGAFP